MSITNLTSEIKGVKLGLNLVRQDMQKLLDRTATLKDRVSDLKDDVVPLQREVHHMQSIILGHSVCSPCPLNRLRRNNVHAVGKS